MKLLPAPGRLRLILRPEHDFREVIFVLARGQAFVLQQAQRRPAEDAEVGVRVILPHVVPI